MANVSPFHHLHFSARKRGINTTFTLSLAAYRANCFHSLARALLSRSSSSIWCGSTPCSSDRRRHKLLSEHSHTVAGFLSTALPYTSGFVLLILTDTIPTQHEIYAVTFLFLLKIFMMLKQAHTYSGDRYVKNKTEHN